MSSAASSVSSSKPRSSRSSRLSSCPTVASVSRRTPAAAVLISGFVSDARNWSRPPSSGAQEQNSLIGLTSFITKNPPMLPRLNRRRAQFVLTKIDEILAWEQRKEAEKDTRFVELGRYLCEVRAGQYWRLENLKSFDEFLERRFPESRRKAYYLMSIHEYLPPQERKELKQVGWTKGRELAKLVRAVLRRDGWRCQLCGSMRNLEVHHREFRSRSGADDERNLITLCSDCHSPIHGKSMRLT